jgi:hypothetical protein
MRQSVGLDTLRWFVTTLEQPDDRRPPDPDSANTEATQRLLRVRPMLVDLLPARWAITSLACLASAVVGGAGTHITR